MAGKRPLRNFTVGVDGHLVTNGVWSIDATLRFREGLSPEVGDRLLGEGRLALIKAIMVEGARGRTHGATSVRVRMDVGGILSEFDLGDVPGGEISH